MAHKQNKIKLKYTPFYFIASNQEDLLKLKTVSLYCSFSKHFMPLSTQLLHLSFTHALTNQKFSNYQHHLVYRYMTIFYFSVLAEGQNTTAT